MKSLILLLCLFALPSFSEEKVSLTVSIDTPHPGYAVEITRVDRTKEGLTVLAKVIAPDPGQMYAQVISSVEDSVMIAAPGGGATVYLLNRSWGWGENPVVKNEAEYLKQIGEATQIPFQRK